MKGRDQRCALASGSDVALAEIADHGDAGHLGQQRRVADLDSEATGRLVANCLAMATDGSDFPCRSPLLIKQRKYALGGQMHPFLLGNTRAGQFVRAAGAQAKQLGAQIVRHGNVMGAEQTRSVILFNECEVESIKTASGHYTYI